VFFESSRGKGIRNLDATGAFDGQCFSHRHKTEEEFKKSHVENAVNVPYMFSTPDGRVKNPDFLTQVAAVCNKEDHLVVVYSSPPPID